MDARAASQRASATAKIYHDEKKKRESEEILLHSALGPLSSCARRTDEAQDTARPSHAPARPSPAYVVRPRSQALHLEAEPHRPVIRQRADPYAVPRRPELALDLLADLAGADVGEEALRDDEAVDCERESCKVSARAQHEEERRGGREGEDVRRQLPHFFEAWLQAEGPASAFRWSSRTLKSRRERACDARVLPPLLAVDEPPHVDEALSPPLRVLEPARVADEALVRVALDSVRAGELAHVLRPREVVRLGRGR